jgi:hypothetical protein
MPDKTLAMRRYEGHPIITSLVTAVFATVCVSVTAAWCALLVWGVTRLFLN